jgi:hypothetical protein
VQAEPESRQPRPRVHADPAYRRFDKLLGYGETDPGAALRGVTRLIDAIEALEQMRKVVTSSLVDRCVRIEVDPPEPEAVGDGHLFELHPGITAGHGLA